MSTTRVCIFCLRHEAHVAVRCTYGLGHEYERAAPKQQTRRRDADLCPRCGLHPRNPAYAASACEHEPR